MKNSMRRLSSTDESRTNYSTVTDLARLRNPKQGGPTDTENLHCLCRRHHNLKTHGGWDIDRGKGLG